MGRTSRVSGGFTYGFMDQVDLFVEEVRDGHFRRGDAWVPLTVNEEVIHRKGQEPVRLQTCRTIHGLVEADPQQPIEDGFYLSRAWAGESHGTVESVEGMLQFVRATNVESAARAVRQLGISANWLLADDTGRIAYQQSGTLPQRRGSGLAPLPGWEEAHDWNGFVDPADLVHEFDPQSGLLVTANEDRNRPGFPQAINLPMASYRAERIHQLLESHERLDLEQMKAAQSDLYSRQAERYLEMLDPFLPDSPEAEKLRRWDRCYDTDSTGAVMFEHLRDKLLEEVFGRGLFGLDAWSYLCRETAMMADYAGHFDSVMFGDDPLWFNGDKNGLLSRVGRSALETVPSGRWGDQRKMVLAHVMFGEKLPRWLGLDVGPIELPGCSATVAQGNIFRVRGRLTCFAPSWRYITDLATDENAHRIAGGPLRPAFFRPLPSGSTSMVRVRLQDEPAA